MTCDNNPFCIPGGPEHQKVLEGEGISLPWAKGSFFPQPKLHPGPCTGKSQTFRQGPVYHLSHSVSLNSHTHSHIYTKKTIQPPYFPWACKARQAACGLWEIRCSLLQIIRMFGSQWVNITLWDACACTWCSMFFSQVRRNWHTSLEDKLWHFSCSLSFTLFKTISQFSVLVLGPYLSMPLNALPVCFSEPMTLKRRTKPLPTILPSIVLVKWMTWMQLCWDNIVQWQDAFG